MLHFNWWNKNKKEEEKLFCDVVMHTELQVVLITYKMSRQYSDQ